MIGLILFIVAGLVLGWAVNHPAAWAFVLIPVAFALAAGDDVDIVVAILGIVLTALAVLAGRALARRRPPPDVGDEPDEDEVGEDEDDDKHEDDNGVSTSTRPARDRDEGRA